MFPHTPSHTQPHKMVSPGGLTSESVPQIDMSNLSQSELHNLSLCSKSTYTPDNNNHPVSPTLIPSTFNKSDSTRRQTYSRPYRRRRLSQKSPSFSLPAPSASAPPRFSRSDSIEAENKSILGHLKKHLGEEEQNLNSTALVVANPEAVIETKSEAMEPSDSNERNRKKRKRGAGGGDKLENLKDGNGVRSGIELSKVNAKGVVVDFQELGKCDEYFSEELKRRTEGLATQEEGLGFLGALNGDWCSKRKKRKFVDASEFGDKFPVGWKILLGLRRKDGIFTVYCRRFVSPRGEYFLSCKESSLFLQSHFGDRDSQETNERTGQVGSQGSGSHAGVLDKGSVTHVDNLPTLSMNNKQHGLPRIENLYDVQIGDIFDCAKCKSTFEQKKDYIKHVLKVHQSTTRKYKLDKSGGGCVIFNDGKNKSQKEKQNCEANQGILSKKSLKSSKELPVQVTDKKSSESPCPDELRSRTSRMDALVKNTPTGKPRSGSPKDMNMEISAANPDHEQSLENLNKMGKNVMSSKNEGVGLVTTVCVWCANKFTRRPVDPEKKADSVGFMCPKCKATISKGVDNGINHL